MGSGRALKYWVRNRAGYVLRSDKREFRVVVNDIEKSSSEACRRACVDGNEAFEREGEV